MAKRLIINADDFGFTKGVNQGILDCHTRGVLTSTSLMVTGHAVDNAVGISCDHPGLSIGLHWDVWGEDELDFDVHNILAVKDEFQRQLDTFHRLLGRMPTHVDSHRHLHRQEHLCEVFRELMEPLEVPLRGDGRVNFVGDFYAQWEWKVTNLEYVSVPCLRQMLREQVTDGWTEFSCHPGYVTPQDKWVYATERETEIETLTDPSVRELIDQLEIDLCSYSDYARIDRQAS